MNILFTSANWRAAIVKRFREALDRRPEGGRVHTVDSDPLAAAAYVSHRHDVAPLYASPECRPWLRELIAREAIDLIIPSTDRDCLYFAENGDVLDDSGARVFLAPPEVVPVMLDKYAASRFWREHGVRVPDTWLPADAPTPSRTQPLIVKPRRDSGTQNTHVVRTSLQRDAALSMQDDACVQSYISGREFSVDILADGDGRMIGAVPRVRLATKGGTSVKTVTVRHEPLVRLTRRLCEAIRAAGILCAQFIEEEASGALYLVEVNLRYGSGLPLAMAAGLDVPELLLRLHRGERPRLADDFYTPGLHMLYYLEPLFLPQGAIHAECCCV
ncbi:MAG: ATP-grasp domain-containing protein [Pirellulales bacterium]